MALQEVGQPNILQMQERISPGEYTFDVSAVSYQTRMLLASPSGEHGFADSYSGARGGNGRKIEVGVDLAGADQMTVFVGQAGGNNGGNGGFGYTNGNSRNGGGSGAGGAGGGSSAILFDDTLAVEIGGGGGGAGGPYDGKYGIYPGNDGANGGGPGGPGGPAYYIQNGYNTREDPGGVGAINLNDAMKISDKYLGSNTNGKAVCFVRITLA